MRSPYVMVLDRNHQKGSSMEQKIRLLGIAPYSEMRPLMLEVSKEYQDIDLTVYVGDLQKGVEMARRNFYNDYDVIISRGGTATMLRERLDLSVIEIPILPFDLLRAMQLAEQVSDHYAIVGFPNVTTSARLLCEVCNTKSTSILFATLRRLSLSYSLSEKRGPRPSYVIW